LAEEPPVGVSVNAPVPILVNGVDITRQPAAVRVGSTVCVANRVEYTSEAERWLFQKWSNGRDGLCQTITEPGSYGAVFSHEVLLVIRSVVTSLQKSLWVPAGVPIEVEVPAEVTEGDKVRYLFQEWSGGDTPFQPHNRIALLKPTVLEVKWTKQYYVQLESGGPPSLKFQGSGWYDDGAGFVMQAPQVVSDDADGVRWSFVRWETVGVPPLVVPNAERTITTVRVAAPYTLQAVYEKQYRVLAVNPAGTIKRTWSAEGAEIVLETPAILEVVPGQERLVFRRWEGLEGLISPKISGIVDRPVDLLAAYDRQLAVTVNSPLGSSGGGWYKEQTTATVTVPAASQRRLVFKTRFAGFAGYSTREPTLRLLVSEPVTVTALYTTEVDLKVLGLLVAVPLELGCLYLVARWLFARSRRTATPPER
jgi:hypothetical protein